MMIERDEQSIWQARAALWELLAFSFRYPDAELAEVVASGEWAEAAAEIATALELPCTPAGDLASLSSLRAEATRLFVGAPDAVVSPYEGVWRAADDGVQALLFVNPHSMEVERFVKSCGLGRPEGTNEPLDHVSAECELMQYLASLEAGIIALPEGQDPAALPGGSPAQAYEVFLRDHVLTWVPHFAEAVVAESRVPFYRKAAGLLGSFAAQPLDNGGPTASPLPV